MSGTNVYEIAPIEDRAIELVRYIVSTVPGAQAELSAKFKPHVDARDYATLISEVLDNIDSVFRTGTDEDVEGAFTLLFSFLKAVPPARFGQTIDKISTVLTSGPTELGKGAPVRLRTLANLYNVISESTGKTEKVAVFSKLIKFASDTRQLDLLYPYFAHAATWQSKWGISDEQTRRLLLTVSTALEKAGDAEQAQAFLIRYLSTFEGSAASAIDDEALSHAKDAAIGYVKAPAVSQRSALPQFAAVRALGSSPAYGQLSELVGIFSHGTLDAYMAFAEKNAPFLTQIGIDNAKSVETMRLLTLVSLAAGSSVGAKIEYSAVSQALQVPATEVEMWVVKGISRGLIEARMDQASQTVTVTRAVSRDFGDQQWTALQSKLRSWRNSVTSLLTTVESGRAPSGSA